MNFTQLNDFRRSHRSYLHEKPIPRDVIERLLAQASLAPSSSNQQGWHIIVVESHDSKRKMFDEACQQQQVLDSSAMLIVCGNLEQYKQLPEIVRNTTTLTDDLRTKIVQGAEKSYGSNPQLARDEAVRSATLFSMAFMYAATNAGFGTGPMIGFDSDKLCQAFGIQQPYFPVMLISMGYVKDEPFPRAWRRPVSSFTRYL